MNSDKQIQITKKQHAIWEMLMRLGKSCGCHQISSRSFFYKQFQFPVCARCTGILLGQFLIAPFCLILGYNIPLINLVLIGIMGVDGLLQYYNILESTNIRRIITGVMGGTGIMSLVVYIILVLWNLIF